MYFDIEHIAKLSCISLNDGEKAIFASQMSEIIEMMDKLPSENLVHKDMAFGSSMELRPDEPSPSLSQKEALMNAPKVQNGCFAVFKTVE